MSKKSGPTGSFDASERTRQLRAKGLLSEEEKRMARRLRREGKEIEEIPMELNREDVPRSEIEKAIENLRTKGDNNTRKTLNVTPDTYDAIAKEQQPGEAQWETTQRLIDELTERRKKDGSLPNKP